MCVFSWCFSALPWRVPEAFFCGFSAQRCPKVIFLASFFMTFRVPARMRERCSRCSGSSIWRVGGGQRIDVFFDVFPALILERFRGGFGSHFGAFLRPKWMEKRTYFSMDFLCGFWDGFGRVSGGLLRGKVSGNLYFSDSCENVKISASCRREFNFPGSGAFEFVL